MLPLAGKPARRSRPVSSNVRRNEGNRRCIPPAHLTRDERMDHRHDILESTYPGQAASYYLAMSIGGTPDLADEGAALILNGTKTATSSPIWDYPDGRIPFVGALSVLLDGQQRAVAVVKTVGVRLVRFRDVTDEMAKAYGEGQRTIEWWQRVIGDWYRTKATRDGQHFDKDTEIIWESISVVRRLTPAMDG